MRRHQRGASLIEALMAFLVLSLGMAALAPVQSRMQAHVDLARQRAQAMQLALHDLEALRAFAAVGAASGVPSFAEIASQRRLVDGGWQLGRQIADDPERALKSATVSVDWTDPGGEPRRIQLPSLIAGTAPALSGALVAADVGPPPAGLRGRSIRIPIDAVDLGNGTSARQAGALTLVYDNTSGDIVRRCDGRDRQGRPDPASCSALDALLLSGWVRFSLAAPPDAARPDDPPLPLAIALVLADAGSADPPRCTTELRDGALAYHCAIATTGGSWSGRSTVVPQGWSVGTRANEHKVCRYSADLDGSGAVDRNAEHPADYRRVEQTLMQQNFLIVRGDQRCPADTEARTVQHQP